MRSSFPDRRIVAGAVLSLFLAVLWSHDAAAGNHTDETPRNNTDSTGNFQQVVRKLDNLTDIYASLRFKGGVSYKGEVGVQDNASRMGIRGAIPVTRGIEAIMQLEVGVGIVGNKTSVKFSGDPGGAVGEVDNVFTSRLGYVGIDTKYGRFTWGKQWSVYSDIGGWTDNFDAFGAEASGTYSANTDGSVSGTGRASNSFQYRLILDFMEAGLQAQNRTISDSSTTIADTYGASLVFRTRFGLRFGAAYNKVRDGVMDPEPGKPRFGDEAFVAGAFYSGENITAIFTASDFRNHELDDQGNYFSGYGLEFYGGYKLHDKWNFYGGFNHLQPRNESVAGEYRLSYLLLGTEYLFGRTSKVFVEVRLDDSENHDGSDPGRTAFAFGMFFDFGY